MPQPHLIRLRGPWELLPLARWIRSADGTLVDVAEALPPGGRARMPADWSGLLGDDFQGRVRHVRRFGRPTGLESGQQVWLALDGAADAASIQLNHQPLGRLSGPDSPARFDITERLLERNELVVDVEYPAAQAAGKTTRCGGLIGEVRLEIVTKKVLGS